MLPCGQEAPLYQDSFGQSPIRRLLNTSWPLLRAFGVDVRVSWTVSAWPLLFWLMFVSEKGWDLPAGEALFWAVVWTVALFANVYTHEMGHITAGRRYGIDASHITLRGLGGLAHMDHASPSPRADIIISIAGPATHLAWMMVLFPAYWWATAAQADGLWVHMLHGFATWQFFMLAFNLLPFYQLDGSKVFRAFLAGRMHPSKASIWTANLGFAGSVMLGLAGLTMWLGDVKILGMGTWGFLLVWIAVDNWFACRRLLLEARWGEGPYGSDPGEAWKRGGEPKQWEAGLAESLREAKKAEKAEAKAAKAQRKEQERRARLQSRIDELLDRINEVGGIENLSASERRDLEQASKELDSGRV